MNLLQRLLLKLHKSSPRLTDAHNSVSTPLGYLPYKRHVNTQASLDEGVQRARKRSYVRGDEC